MMQTHPLLSIAQYFMLSVCLLGLGAKGAIAQASSPLQALNSSSGSPSFLPEVQVLSALSMSITLSPITPACPFPDISVSSPANQVSDFSGVGVGQSELDASESFSPGDNSDAELMHRVVGRIDDKQLDEARSLAHQIRDPQIQVEALLRVAQGYVEEGQLERALEIVEPLPTSAEPSVHTRYSREDVLWNLATVYLNQGQLEQALSIAEQVEQGQSFILQEIARGYAARGQPERAVEVLSQAVVAFRTSNLASTDAGELRFSALSISVIWTIFASDYLELNQNEQAVELLNEALASAQALPDLPLPLWGFQGLADLPELYMKAGEEDKAAEAIAFVRETAERYEQPITRSNALIQTALGYLALQQPEQAVALLTQAEAIAKADPAVAQENIIWVGLAKAYALLGQYDRAFELIAAVHPPSLREQINQTLVCAQEAR